MSFLSRFQRFFQPKPIRTIHKKGVSERLRRRLLMEQL